MDPVFKFRFAGFPSCLLVDGLQGLRSTTTLWPIAVLLFSAIALLPTTSDSFEDRSRRVPRSNTDTHRDVVERVMPFFRRRYQVHATVSQPVLKSSSPARTVRGAIAFNDSSPFPPMRLAPSRFACGSKTFIIHSRARGASTARLEIYFEGGAFVRLGAAGRILLAGLSSKSSSTIARHEHYCDYVSAGERVVLFSRQLTLYLTHNLFAHAAGLLTEPQRPIVARIVGRSLSLHSGSGRDDVERFVHM